MTVEEYFKAHMPAIKVVIIGMAFKFRMEQRDMVQDVLLHAWRKRHSYQDDNGLKGFMGWIWLIARNQAINKYRVVRGHGGPMYDLIDEINGGRIADRYDARQHLAAVWRSLRAQFGRKTLIMYLYARGYKMWEISEELGIPGGTVKNLIHQFRKHLKEEYA